MIELDGTVFDFLQTAHCEPFFTKLPFVDALYDGRGIFPKSVVEVYGQVTHTPVSILLQHIAAQFVLPKSCGGMDGVVYYFDHGMCIDVDRKEISFCNDVVSWSRQGGASTAVQSDTK